MIKIYLLEKIVFVANNGFPYKFEEGTRLPDGRLLKEIRIYPETAILAIDIKENGSPKLTTYAYEIRQILEIDDNCPPTDLSRVSTRVATLDKIIINYLKGVK